MILTFKGKTMQATTDKKNHFITRPKLALQLRKQRKFGEDVYTLIIEPFCWNKVEGRTQSCQNPEEKRNKNKTMYQPLQVAMTIKLRSTPCNDINITDWNHPLHSRAFFDSQFGICYYKAYWEIWANNKNCHNNKAIWITTNAPIS